MAIDRSNFLTLLLPFFPVLTLCVGAAAAESVSPKEVEIGDAGSWIESVDFSPDGSELLVSTHAGTTHLVDVQSGEIRRKRPGMLATFSPDGKTIGAIVKFRSVVIRAAESGEQIRSWKAHDRRIVADLQFSPDGRRLATAGWDNHVKTWDVTTGAVRDSLQHWFGTPRSVDFSPDSAQLVVGLMGNASRPVYVFDMKERRAISQFNGHTGPPHAVLAVAFSPDGKIVASAGFDQKIRFWKANTGEPVGSVPGHRPTVRDLLFTSNGSILVSGGDDNTVKIWHVQSKKLLKSLASPDEPRHLVRCVDIHEESGLIASGHETGIVRLWRFSSGGQ